MKKFLYILSILSVAFLSSCNNKAIPESIIDPPVIENQYDVNVTVSLSDFFQCYDFIDKKHEDITQIPEIYRTFNSEFGLFIQVRTLIYNENGTLVDSLLSYSSNTNQVANTTKLKVGKYTAISTLVFAELDESTGHYNTNWSLVDKESLIKAKLREDDSWSIWSILSYDSSEFNVSEGKTTNVYSKPSPIGALVYHYFDNFWTTESDYPQKVDNGIRELAMFTQKLAIAYNLNPSNSDHYEYANATGSHEWKYLIGWIPGSSYTCFQGEVPGYYHILAPQCNIVFGYVLDGEDGFYPFGEDDYTFQSGKTYLAVWDYLYEGNPYFGLADNNHWDRSKSYMMKSTSNDRIRYTNKEHLNESKFFKAIR